MDYDQRAEGRGYLPWITFITITYLIFELSFNARLLDVIGGSTTAVAVHHIEDWGRFLSGMAVTILVWGTFIMPKQRLSVALRMILMALSCALCLKVVYSLEKKLVTHFVDVATGQQRKEAVAINFVIGGVKDGSINLDGLPLTVGHSASASDKQMAAILPFYVMSIKNIDMKISSGIKDAIHNTIIKNGASSQALFDNAYKPFVNHMHDVFKDYARLEEGHGRNSSFSNDTYRRHLTEIFGYVPDRTYYRFSDFFASSGVQAKANEAMSIENAGINIPADLTPASFRGTLWPEIIAFKTQDVFSNQIDHPAQDYEDGGRREMIGRDAMEALVAAPVALFFSVLGAITHIFKSLNYLLRWRAPRLRFRKTLLVSGLGMIAVLVGLQGNHVVETGLYQAMSNAVASYYPHGRLVSAAFTWLIKMQSVFYPLNEAIRSIVLFGMTFGA